METFTTTGTLSGNSSTYLTDFRISSGTTAAPHTVSFSNPINFTSTQTKQIMQNKVAVFQIVRDEDDKIIKTEFIKELWVETKNGQSVDFQVARDKDLAEYEMSDLSIKTIFSLNF
jgi:ribosomal protein L1